MSNNVIWEIGIEISEKVFLEIESKLNVTYPELYKVIVLKNNGGRPIPYIFDTNHEKGKVLAELIKIEDIIENIEFLHPNYPENIIPFQDDASGNILCFDYRGTKENPPVILYDHELSAVNYEATFHFVASSFEEFLEGLYEPEDDDLE